MRRALAPLLCLALAPGCAPLITPLGVALTAGATGGTMSLQDRGLGGAISDNAIVLGINEAWLANDAAIFRKVSTSINDGIVVLTGHVTYRETAKRAEVLARGVEGVRDVKNHIRVDEEPSLGTMASDRWITMRLRADITFAADVHAVNYAIDTVAGTVFLSGVARDQGELDRVVALAKATSGVRDVVTAVRLRSEPLPPANRAIASATRPAPAYAPPHAAPNSPQASLPSSSAAAPVTVEALPPP